MRSIIALPLLALLNCTTFAENTSSQTTEYKAMACPTLYPSHHPITPDILECQGQLTERVK